MYKAIYHDIMQKASAKTFCIHQIQQCILTRNVQKKMVREEKIWDKEFIESHMNTFRNESHHAHQSFFPIAEQFSHLSRLSRLKFKRSQFSNRKYISSWWFQPIWKILYSQNGSFPPNRGLFETTNQIWIHSWWILLAGSYQYQANQW